MMTQQFDVVLISSSPLMLIEALRLRKEGKSVAIIDDRSTVGGAWYTKDLPEWGNVEVGCHYIANNKATYHFLENVLDLNFQDMQPQPFIWLKGLPLSHRGFQHLPNNYFRIRSAWIEKDRPRLIRELFRLPFTLADSLRRELFNRQPYRYPVGGCGVIVQRLEALARDQGVQFILETSVERIVIQADKKGGVCFTNRGPIQFAQLFINSSTRLPRLQHCDDTISVVQDYRVVQHMTLHLVGEKRKPFTYAGLYGGGVVNRVSDVGMYASNADEMRAKRRLLVSVRVSSRSLRLSDAERAQAILERLITAGFINPDATLVDYYVDQFDYIDTPDEVLDAIEHQLKPAIIVRRSREFGDSLKAYTRRYTKMTIGA